MYVCILVCIQVLRKKWLVVVVRHVAEENIGLSKVETIYQAYVERI